MSRIKRCTKKYTQKKRVHKGGGFMDLIRRGKKNKVNEKTSDKDRIDLIILALGGIEQVNRMAKAYKDKLKNEFDNEAVKQEKSPERDKEGNVINPLQEQAPDKAPAVGPLPPPPSGGRKTRRRYKY